jgi:phosphoribosyl 1,2-cyclic phosphate phosphodiesterase
MKVIFLGTGTSQGVPVIGCPCEVCHSLDFRNQRLRVSVLVETQGKSLVIDTGPDFRQQMLRERVGKVDAVLYTHEHKDHTAGLDDIRAYNFRINGVEVKSLDDAHIIPVYARQKVLNQLKQEFAYIFADPRVPGVPMIEPHPIENVPFQVEGLSVIPIEVMHYKLSIFGFRIENFTYITDASAIAADEMDKVRGSEVVVINALQRQEHISHFNLQQAIAILQELAPQQAYLTHLSHKMGLHEELERELPDFIRVAYDGLKINM